jgi:hypothetical protein
MRVLVACEFSGIVRDAFRVRGHDAVSCDLLPTERPGPHIQGGSNELFSQPIATKMETVPSAKLTMRSAGVQAQLWTDTDTLKIPTA